MGPTKACAAARLIAVSSDCVAVKLKVALAPGARLVTRQAKAAGPLTHEFAGSPLMVLLSFAPDRNLSPTMMLLSGKPVLFVTVNT
jgi:hypothetical protein